jgi:hypothetical protein
MAAWPPCCATKAPKDLTLFRVTGPGYPATMERSSKREDRTEKERRHSRDPKDNPGNRSSDREPHHALNNPASEPDPTEFPDPYDRRPDPRDPQDDDSPEAPRGPSTSEPHPEDFDDVKPVKGDEDVR